LFLTPGPKFKGVTDEANTDMLYYNWVDQFDAFGLGRNVPIATGSYSDALLALSGGKFVVSASPIRWVSIIAEWRAGSTIRTPAGRAGDCGRTTGATIPGTTKAFQLRPDPLAK
jgi:hypothetical protein